MKRILLFLILLVTFAWPSAGQSNSQSLSFDDLGLGGGGPTSGTYNSNDTFSFDVLLTFNGYDALGLSLWLQTDPAFAGSLSITGITYGTTFSHSGPIIFPIFFDPDGGETVDLGGGADNPVPPDTYFVAHITFGIAGAVPGTYDLASSTMLPRASIVSGFDGTTFSDNPLPASHYSITIVPEPATLGLLGLGATGLVAMLLRRRKH